jgi:5-methylphenazine-1-carboxylate 1-monooxygenase
MRALIIGAGIGGLATALRLRHVGIDCAVYEQSESIHELGVGINLLPNSIGELAEVGLLDELCEAGIRTRELRYAHRLGPEILLRPCGLKAGFTLPQISLHRGRLQGVLFRAVRERLGPDAVRTGCRLTGFDQDDRGVRAYFAAPDGTALDPVRGDVLVAADGIHSTVRSAFFPGEGPPRWNGVTMWRGAVDWPMFGSGLSMLVAGGNAAKLVVYPIGPGRSRGTRLTNWAICIQTGQDGDPPPHRQDWSRPASADDIAGHIQRFRTKFVDHAGLVRASGQCFEFPMCDRDPLPSWSHGRVTLLGDAAHPMYPMGSNGAGQAIMDATCLGRCLTSHADPAVALRMYEAERLPVTSDVVIRNRAGGPERVIDEVERRAPDGFRKLADVIDKAELEQIVSGYAQASGQSAVGRPAP